MSTPVTNASSLSPLLQQWKDRGRLIRLQDHDIFVLDEGNPEQPVLLLIHGFPTSSWDWEPMWPMLRQNYRLVCWDMLGFGFSDKPNQRNYTIHGQADIGEALVRELGLNKFHVLAHDYGVSVAQEMLARQQDGNGQGIWLSCCFLNGGLFPESHRALLIQKLMLSPLGPVLNRILNFDQFTKSFSQVFGEDTKPSREELNEFWQVINYNDGKHLFHNLITYMRDRKLHRERWVAALQNAQIPLAVINGSVDPVSGAHLVTRYQELNCRLDYLKQLETIGHYPQVEAPETVANSFLEFLATV